MYPVISLVSLIIRGYLCYLSIEQLPIASNAGINWLIGQIVSIFVIFRIICYFITGVLIEKWDIDSSTLKSVIYFFVYIPIVGLYWLLLWVLTDVFCVLPLTINL